MRFVLLSKLSLLLLLSQLTAVQAQRVRFPNSQSGLRPTLRSDGRSQYASEDMVPINPATQAGIHPSSGNGSTTFDPYARASQLGPRVYPAQSSLGSPPPLGGSPPSTAPYQPNPTAGAAPGSYPGPGVYPNYSYPGGNALGSGGNYAGAPAPNYANNTGVGLGYPAQPFGGQSSLGGPPPSGIYPPASPNYRGTQPGVYPNTAPGALFPGNSYTPGFLESIFGGGAGVFGGSLGQGYSGNYQAGGTYPPPSSYDTTYGWNPPGTIWGSNPGYPPVIRFFQGPRFRHAYIHGGQDADSVAINDSDVGLAFAWPNFLFSTQPLYIVPTFSLHQWSGPRPSGPVTADLPPIAYSAFLDAGWESDPNRILGVELTTRVGVFSDFNTFTSDSLRVQGSALGRIRLTPRATFKLGVAYLDRNRVKLLPAGGLVWQPNPDTRFDIFFPEPKLAHFLSTIGTADLWWYVGGFYGGGAWTVERDSSDTDYIDINDIRLVLGLEWGRSNQIRQGRRVGFLEVGYVFDRELLYKYSDDDLDLQDTFMFRAGIGY